MCSAATSRLGIRLAEMRADRPTERALACLIVTSMACLATSADAASASRDTWPTTKEYIQWRDQTFGVNGEDLHLSVVKDVHNGRTVLRFTPVVLNTYCKQISIMIGKDIRCAPTTGTVALPAFNLDSCAKPSECETQAWQWFGEAFGKEAAKDPTRASKAADRNYVINFGAAQPHSSSRRGRRARATPGLACRHC